MIDVVVNSLTATNICPFKLSCSNVFVTNLAARFIPLDDELLQRVGYEFTLSIRSHTHPTTHNGLLLSVNSNVARKQFRMCEQ